VSVTFYIALFCLAGLIKDVTKARKLRQRDSELTQSYTPIGLLWAIQLDASVDSCVGLLS